MHDFFLISHDSLIIASKLVFASNSNKLNLSILKKFCYNFLSLAIYSLFFWGPFFMNHPVVITSILNNFFMLFFNLEKRLGWKLHKKLKNKGDA